MADAIVAARGVGKQYFRASREAARHFDAVAATDLELAAGELVVLMGRSGSGKTTLLNMLAGLLQPSEGTVLLEGCDLYALDDSERSRLRNEKIGVIPQGQTALHSLSVLENVMLPYLMYRPDDGVEARARELLAGMGIDALADTYPVELSGGEMRRMAIARALVCEPAVLMADEPTGDLDDDNTRQVFELLRARADAGSAVLLVTHERDAADYADRMLHMDAGVLV